MATNFPGGYLTCKIHRPSNKVDSLGIEPRASRMLSGCDTTTPTALLRRWTSDLLLGAAWPNIIKHYTPNARYPSYAASTGKAAR